MLYITVNVSDTSLTLNLPRDFPKASIVSMSK